MKLSALDYVLIIFFILSVAIIANCKEEPVVSMYQAESDKNKTVVECWYTDGRSQQTLVIKNTELESEKLVQWFKNVCVDK